MNKFKTTLVIFCLTLAGLYGQTTGKIAGKIVDGGNGEPLIGVNVILEGTSQGAISDLDGYYNLINIRPGSYTLKFSMIGYEINVLEDVRVSTNRTTYADASLNTSTLEGSEVIVTASKISTKKDQTSTVKNISADDIAVLPVENIGAVVGMQAGVVAGHFRGGRSGEVSYLIDGIQVDEVYGGNNAVVSIETEAVQDLEVITGTFNAEYGKAMSGIVNAVTKDGSPEFHMSVSSSIATYFTNNEYQGEDSIFLALEPFGFTDNEDDHFNLNTNYDNKFMISGPILGDRIGFFVNYRNQVTAGHLNGIRHFNVWDESNYRLGSDPGDWITEDTGDSTYVSMNSSENTSLMVKLSFKLGPKMRSSFMYNKNDDQWQGYNHTYKYNPDGAIKEQAHTEFYTFQFNHMLTNKLFYDLKLSQTDNYYGSYLFEDPEDHFIADAVMNYQGTWYAKGDTVWSYVNDLYANTYGPGFFTGGQAKDHTIRETNTKNLKFDMTWQANNRHSFKTGFQMSNHDIYNEYQLIQNQNAGGDNENIYRPRVLGNNTIYADIYKKSPVEKSFYLQDKMEFNEMVINLGLRFDSFDANTVYPSQRRNPANSSIYALKDSAGNPLYDADSNIVLDETRMSTYLKSKTVNQVSPRFGLAYQLGNRAVLHFSYGHFFQMPAYYAMYSNDAFLVGPSDFGTTMGNANLGADSLGLNAQKTVSYEIGLWQELTPQLGLEINLYYRDIYDLLSTAVVSTYNQIRYGLYTNKDYGNVRGLELKLDYGVGGLRTNLNYTLQYTKGNSDNPLQTFNRAGSSVDEVNRMIAMSWDQRHTFNLSIGYSASYYGAHLTGYYNSGTTYTFSPQSESPLARINLAPNNEYRSASYHVDLTAYIQIPQVLGFNSRVNISVYNLLDRYNEVAVNGATGRAYTAIVRDSDLASHRSNFNEYEDRYKNPSMFSTPRQIKIGLEVDI
ncbi:MAG: TonB-dependent receptor [Candidatus Marinimicrobia bacterium]|nr:TonB-dependent receptor [Candidatus Neomarinimicrobiota bacterium]